MNKKNIAAVLAAAVLCAGLTGCGEDVIPDMTDEQVRSVGEYIAITMMKYDANHRSRLVDLSRLEAWLEEKPEVPAEPEATMEPSGSGTGPVGDTPVIDPTENENPYTMEEVLALPEGVTLAYSGQKVCDAYPDSGEIGGLVAVASNGKKFLALEYMISNTTGQEQKVDLLSTDTVFRVTVNGTYSKKALYTGLPEDMTTYIDTLPANSSDKVVILVEMAEETAVGIESISLNVKNDARSCTVQLL